MSDGVFKAPQSKHPPDFVKVEEDASSQISPLPKKRRTAEDFITFCNFILEYENYEAQKQEELRLKTSSPIGSTGSSTESFESKGTSSLALDERHVLSLEDRKPPDLGHALNGKNEDSWDLVTCYCLKPFAGRPMIECSECLTWIHLSCAKIRKSNIPEEFICQRCRDAKLTTRRSQRVRNEKRRISA